MFLAISKFIACLQKNSLELPVVHFAGVLKYVVSSTSLTSCFAPKLKLEQEVIVNKKLMEMPTSLNELNDFL